MSTSPRGMHPDGYALLREFEGCKLKSYRDLGNIATVGYGHTGPDVHDGLVITQERAEELLKQDVQKFCAATERLVHVKLNAYQHASVVCFMFNIGEGAFSRSTALRRLNKSDYFGYSNEIPRWAHCGGALIPGLIRRRRAEQLLFLKRYP